MRCYYEELGVPRDSNDADIKSAYRKLALRWHPDKNLECLQEAKERFLLIQQAYEVLSDQQERAWYDNHREQILRGKNSEYEEKSLDVFQYFTSSCYKGYGDDTKSFYSVYNDVFQKLAAEDAEFMDDADEIDAIPCFGNADSSYEDIVGPFYAYWQSYSTKKTYEWLCPYNILEIKDRYILRKVEKEMKKIVQKARKDRNEEVRNLVSFIRKRDRRMQAYRRQLEERAELNRQKQEEKRREQLRKRQEDLAAARQNNSAFNEGYEEQLKQLEQEYGSESDYEDEDTDSDENEGDQEDDEEYVDELYCVACNKSFKNANAFANHEDSKKHRENMERLRLEMGEEEEAYNEATKSDSNDSLDKTESALNNLDLDSESHDEAVEDLNENSNELEIETPNETTKRTKKNKKSKKANKVIANKPLLSNNGEDSKEESDIFAAQQKAEDSSDGDDWGNNKKGGKRNKSKKQPNTQKRENETKLAKEALPTEAAKTITAPTANSIVDGVEHICATCKSTFDSKNKLFAHLKKTNHGVYIPKAQPVVDGKPSKAKGKRK